jgi:uncharacterized Ntn-hydrolase superfamily protein
MAEIAHGPNGLDHLRSGSDAAEALRLVLAADSQAATRQVAVVDAEGRAAAHTGASCIEHAGHVVGDGFSAQANMMWHPGVPEAMAAAFTASTGALPIRLLDALDAAQAAGGDLRGQQSASLAVVEAVPAAQAAHDRVLDVRVEDHPEPLVELRRLVGLGLAYRGVDEAEASAAAGDLDAALAVYAASVAQQPGEAEFPFWQAVMLAGLGRCDEARAAMRPVLAGPGGEGWRELLRRLPAADLLTDEAADQLLR